MSWGDLSHVGEVASCKAACAPLGHTEGRPRPLVGCGAGAGAELLPEGELVVEDLGDEPGAGGGAVGQWIGMGDLSGIIFKKATFFGAQNHCQQSVPFTQKRGRRQLWELQRQSKRLSTNCILAPPPLRDGKECTVSHLREKMNHPPGGV